MPEDKFNKILENNVSLQNKTVDLVTHISALTKKVEHLIDIFEGAAKDVKEVKTVDEQMAALSGKLESLLEQNKNIAKALILLEKYIRGRTELAVAQPKPLTEYKY